LFWVGGTQPRVILAVVDVFGGGSGGGEGAGGMGLGVVAEPVPLVVSLVVSVVVVDVLELALVLAVAAADAAPPPLSSPQPARAIAKLPVKDAITTRQLRANPRLDEACIFPTPDESLQHRPGSGRSYVSRVHERAAVGTACLTHEAV
jgi:hypothetical protein